MVHDPVERKLAAILSADEVTIETETDRYSKNVMQLDCSAVLGRARIGCARTP